MTVTRLLDQDRGALTITVDGAAIAAKRGDTLLTAMLAAGLDRIRTSEFGDGGRTGFCWMGACQDCWVLVEGRATRACTTLAMPGMMVTRR